MPGSSDVLDYSDLPLGLELSPDTDCAYCVLASETEARLWKRSQDININFDSGEYIYI